MLIIKNFLNNKYSFLALFALLVLLDLFFVFLHVNYGDDLMFNLDWERNYPTYYQGIKLLLVSVFSILYIFIKREKIRKFGVLINLFWIIFILFGLLTSYDEVFELHESAPKYLVGSQIESYAMEQKEAGFTSSIWLIYVTPFVIFGLIVLIFFLKVLFKKYRFNVSLLIFAAICFILSFYSEFLGTDTINFFSENYENIMIFEEFVEMLASTFLLTFVYQVIIKKDE